MLTKEQFKRAIDAGFSTDQIIQFEKKRDAGEIMTPETMATKQRQRNFASGRTLENAGQMVGGLAGSLAGPAGAALGGIGGRMLGKVATYETQDMQKSPMQYMMNLAKDPLLYPLRRTASYTPEQKMGLVKAGGVGTVGEAAGAVLGPIAGKGASMLGKTLAKTFIPKTVADRGLKEGFKKLLNPAYYKEKLPSNLVKRVEGMFDQASNRFGALVENAVKHPKFQFINTNQVRESLKTSLKEVGINSVKDIDNIVGLGKNKAGLVKDTILEILNTRKPITPYALWLKRRAFDKLRYGQKWSDEAMEVLDRIRYSMNSPIRQAGPAIAKYFDEYSFVQQAKELLGKRTEKAIERKTTGEIMSPSIEGFIKTLMSPEKSEIRNVLMNIDPNLSNIMFDVASAKVLGRQFIPGSPFQTLFGKMINPKFVAQVGREFQRPYVKPTLSVGGRMFPIAISEAEEGYTQ